MSEASIQERPPTTTIKIPGLANRSCSLTEPLLKADENGQQRPNAKMALASSEGDLKSGVQSDMKDSSSHKMLSSSSRTEATTEATTPSKLRDIQVGAGAGLLYDLTTNELDNTVGKFLRQGSLAAVIFWLMLLTAAFRYAPADSFEMLEGAERSANVTVLGLLLYTNISRVARMVFRDGGFDFVNSGVMVGYATVQTIAIVSISLMIFFPTPVIIDPVTGIRSHLVRWAEWTSAGFLMTFLVESVDLPVSTTEQNRNNKPLHPPTIAWIHGIAIGISTAGGGISAFCTSWNAWLAVIGISWLLFSSLFVRLYQRYNRFKNIGPGVSAAEKEDSDRARYSLKTIAVCTTVWTALAMSWTVIAIATPFVSSESFFSNPALTLISESLFESISKIWYADLLIEIHDIVFDDASRTLRRLEDLRNLMAGVWDHSSDILIWGSRGLAGDDNIIQGIVSPKGGDFLGKDPHLMPNGRSASTLLIEIDLETQQHRCFMLDLSAPITRESAMTFRNKNLQQTDLTHDPFENDDNRNVAAIVDLLCEAHCSEHLKHETRMCDLVSEADGKIHQFEANISRLTSSDSTLIVIRDISERFEKFEAEKKLVEERTARRKDSQANKFTRHEIKNSILAAIGLVENIRENANKTTSSSQSTATGSSNYLFTSAVPSMLQHASMENMELRETEECADLSSSSLDTLDTSYTSREDSYAELDNTLRDVLDTIMDHAMSLDVINEEYAVRKERVDVPFVLSNIKRQTSSGPGSSRFLISSKKDSFPDLGLDPRLLRHIYQNSLSNATRYGKPNGKVQTVIDYDESKKEFTMEVINEPGPGHKRLASLPPDEVDAKVFSQGSRLVSDGQDEDLSEVHATNSSGDGAWIMRKCATVMKGSIKIDFKADRTVLTFQCPAKIVKKPGTIAHGSNEFTRLPANTWGIAVDDSGIQRKLMDRFLKIAGIDSSHRIILGKDASECYNFCDVVEEILLSNPDAKVLLIADENLDVVDGGARSSTVSGSLCIEKLLKKLGELEERRLLALVRSANDSGSELKLYMSRAHGFLPKAPIDKDGVLSVLQPWWMKRFAGESTNNPRQEMKRSDSTGSLESDAYDVFHEIEQNIEVIAALCRVGSSLSLRNRWKPIKDKLHSLKGDLKSVIVSSKSGDDLEEVIADIDSLRAGAFPRNLHQKWVALEAKLYRIISSNR